jgi:hypothetical protein
MTLTIEIRSRLWLASLAFASHLPQTGRYLLGAGLLLADIRGRRSIPRGLLRGRRHRSRSGTT